MEGVEYSNNKLLADQVRNLRQSERQDQRAVKNRSVGENIPKTGTGIFNIEPAENTGKLEKTELCIKNMVSIRCKMVVKAVLENLELNYSTVELGEVEIIGSLSDAKHEQLKHELLKFGLELLEDRKIILVEKMKNVIVEMVHYSDELPKMKFSEYLSEKLNHNYIYLSNLFSEVKGMSIQHFIILHKIERVKELLVYEELNLSEIAWKLHYSSVAHLSIQFKKMTGLTPTHFKNMRYKRLKNLEDL
jgi:YesN/AraC family two-component response regulator